MSGHLELGAPFDAVAGRDALPLVDEAVVRADGTRDAAWGDADVQW